MSLIVFEVPTPWPFAFLLFCSLCTYWLKRAYFLAESCLAFIWDAELTMFWTQPCELYCLPLCIAVAVAVP